MFGHVPWPTSFASLLEAQVLVRISYRHDIEDWLFSDYEDVSESVEARNLYAK